MSALCLDGAQVTSGGRGFTVVDEPPDEDGHGYRGYTCDTCEGTVGFGDDALAAHECFECPGCHEWFPKLPAVDAENGQRYCTDDCLDGASERYWTAVWT